MVFSLTLPICSGVSVVKDKHSINWGTEIVTMNAQGHIPWRGWITNKSLYIGNRDVWRACVCVCDITSYLTLLKILQGLFNLSSVQSLSHVQIFVTPWAPACQASLSNTNSRSLPKLMSIESVMPSNHLILCCSLLLLPSISPSIRVFLNESALPIRWPKYWSFGFNISPSNEHPGLISFRMD